MDWAAEQLVVDRLHPPPHHCGVTVEARGVPARPEPGSDDRAALADRGVKHPLYHTLHQGVGQRKAMARAASPHSWVMCIDGNVMTVLSNGPCSRRSQLTDQKCSTNRAAASDGAHRSRSNTDVLAARPTTPRRGAGRIESFRAPMKLGYETVRLGRRVGRRYLPSVHEAGGYYDILRRRQEEDTCRRRRRWLCRAPVPKEMMAFHRSVEVEVRPAGLLMDAPATRWREVVPVRRALVRADAFQLEIPAEGELVGRVDRFD